MPTSSSGSADAAPRRWDAASRAAFGPTLGGLNVSALSALAVLSVGVVATAIAAHGRSLVELLVVVVLGALLAGLAATVTWVFVWPPTTRRAAEAFVWIGEFDLERGAALIGTKPTIENMKRYVRDAPERAEDRWLRVEALASMGDLDEAAAIAERLPDTTPVDRVERAGLLGYLDWLTGGDGRVEELRRAVAAIEPVDGDDRLRSEVTLALAEVRGRVAAGDPDPAAPLRAVRDRLGARADGVMWLAARRQVGGFLTAAAIGVGVLTVLDWAFSTGGPLSRF